MVYRITRRGFLKGTALAAGVTLLTNSLSVSSYAQNQKVRFANVGVGGRGGAHVGPAAGEELVAICDVSEGSVNKVAEKNPAAKKFSDWRKMFDAVGKDIDGVFVATPDHTHFPVAYTAIMMGKHCYCEKPLTHSIWEARTLAEAVKAKKVASQMGNQGHANEGNRRVVEWVRAGVIGDVKEVHSWTNRPIWPQGKMGPFKEADAPAGLNWDVWLGVAPQRKYMVKDDGKSPVHPFAWRGWFDYGCGAVGDMGCHTWDCVWWSLDPIAPLSAEPIKVVDLGTETFPKQMTVKWEFGPSADGKRPAFTAFWHEGGLKPEVPDEIKNDPTREKKNLPGSGSLFIGTKGKLLVEGDYGDSPKLIPQATMDEFKKNQPPKMESSPGHHKEFIMACKGEKPWDFPKSNFTYAGPLVEAMNLANVAARLGKKITWDPKTLKCPGVPEADALIKRPYRAGFVKV